MVRVRVTIELPSVLNPIPDKTKPPYHLKIGAVTMKYLNVG